MLAIGGGEGEAPHSSLSLQYRLLRIEVGVNIQMSKAAPGLTSYYY